MRVIASEIPIARPQLGPDEEAAVIRVMRSGALVQGAEVAAFEAEFATATESTFAIATSNGTTALFLALLAMKLGPGDEVITSPLTFIASANAIRHTGAIPVFADVDETLNIDPEAVEALISPRTRAIMPVHLHGNPCDVTSLSEICRRYGLELLQDACQAIGATLNGQGLGRFSTAAYSLYATKNVTTAEGGMITTNDPEVAAKCASLRHQAYADGKSYLHEEVGYNFRMTELQAAIGRVQLGKLSAITNKRRQNASFYDSTVDSSRFPRPRVLAGHGHVYHQYVIRVQAASGWERDALRSHLASEGIATGVHYPLPVHLQPPYRAENPVRCTHAEAAAADMVSIPVHPGLSDRDRERVAEALQKQMS